MSRPSRPLVALSRIVVLVAVFVPLTSSGASATERDFNVLGNTNGTYGNQGYSYSVQDLFDNIYYSNVLYGEAYPTSIALQEICYTWANPNTQYKIIWSMLQYTGHWYARNFYTAKNPGSPLCDGKGNAVLGLKNTQIGSEWNGATQGAFPPEHQASGDEDLRGYTCVYPVTWVIQYTTCSAHLTNRPDPTAKLNQHQDYLNNFAYNVLIGKPVYFGGDFNAQPLQPGPQLWYSTTYAHEIDFYSQFTSPAGARDKKIDYIFYNGFPAPATVTHIDDPSSCNKYGTTACTRLHNNLVSDHAIVHGY